MAVGDAFLSAFLQVLFDRLASRDFLGLLRGPRYDDLLELLKITLLSVTALLNDAEVKQFYIPAVEKWLHMAKDALYDAEDILDELATDAFKCKLEAESASQASPNQVTNWNLICASLNPFGRRIESKIKKIIDKLEFIAKYKHVLGLQDGVGGRLYGAKQRIPTTSLVDETCVYGRHNDKEVIIELLLRDEARNNKVGVVPIVGMCGIGKTTLAQLVYNDERVVNHFDLTVWVFVSDQFDVVRVTKTILKSVSSDAADLSDLNLLQVSLREKLVGKKFLLVLDDVWDKRNNEWDLIWNPLKAGAKGSKIIVTTQYSNVASSMATVPAHHLGGLSFEDCWSLFLGEAFENSSIDVPPALEKIGRQIVIKCEGLPLAAKRLGILLRSREQESEWIDILNRKVWDLPDDESDIFEALTLSYHHLPADLKLCFAYCSVFPVDYEIDKELLVLLWMAEGFVQQSKGKKRPEEIGGEYFNELVSRSFFQQSTRDSSRFVMHGLMKELAHFVSGEFCFRLEDGVKEGNQTRIFEKARYSSYIRCKRDVLAKFEAFNAVECLRTFLPLDPTGEIGVSYLAKNVPHNLLPKLRYLRVLSFSAYRITELPDSIGNLKHLRFLDLSCTAISVLPDSVSTLYNLQTLILWQCRSLNRLPAKMGNLTSLRHLRISGCRLKEMPLQMGRLKNLQTLSHFIVGKDSGSGVRELKYLSQLKGALVIAGLQNLVSFMDAMEANLKDKEDLDLLVFQWSFNVEDSTVNRDEASSRPQLRRTWKDLGVRGKRGARYPSFGEYMQEPFLLKVEESGSLDDSRDEGTETEVLEMLQPHKNIKKLIIKDYCGIRFPSWIGSPLFSKMVFLKLSNCKKCKSLPSLGQLPSLKDLMIEGMVGIKMVSDEFYGNECSSILPFPMLENLRFENMAEWEEWSPTKFECAENFQSLQNIEILNCPKLKKFLLTFPSLKTMSIKGCEELTALPKLPIFGSLEQGREYPCLLELSLCTCPKLRELPSSFPSLEMLEIDGCPEPAVLPELPSICELELRKCGKGVLQRIVEFTSLSYLHMSQISDATCLVEGFFQHLSALEELQIIQFNHLATLSNTTGLENLPDLQQLEISGCPNLMELPQSFCKLLSLKELRVWNCPSLVSIPATGLPATLVALEIKDCESLQILPEWMMCNKETLFSLQYLVIEGCRSLKSLPRGELPPTLKELEIQDCMNLECLPMMIHNNMSLEYFKIAGCHSIRSFPRGALQLPLSTLSTVLKLKQLIISNCKNLESLPEGLHNLTHLDHMEVSECPLLVSFPEHGFPTSMLQSVRVSNCRNLRSLPDRMYSLTSLQELCIDGCSSLVSFPDGGLPTNLVSLSILECENLKPSYEWGLHRLSCLTEFSFGGCQGLVSFPEDFLLPINISSLHLRQLPHLKALPKGLKAFTSLETLDIWDCDNLHALPEDRSSEMLLNVELWNIL